MNIAQSDQYLYELLSAVPLIRPQTGEPRVYPVVQGGEELEFPAIVYRAIGGRFVSSFKTRKQREIDYYVTIHATSHSDIGTASDQLIEAISEASADLSGPIDGFEVAEGLDGSIGGYYTRQYFVTLKI